MYVCNTILYVDFDGRWKDVMRRYGIDSLFWGTNGIDRLLAGQIGRVPHPEVSATAPVRSGIPCRPDRRHRNGHPAAWTAVHCATAATICRTAITISAT